MPYSVSTSLVKCNYKIIIIIIIINLVTSDRRDNKTLVTSDRRDNKTLMIN